MNLFKLMAKLTLDSKEYESGLAKAKSGLSKVGSAMGTIAKVGAAAVGVGATAVGALGKQAIDAYANFEQLKGGVETLFGAQGMTISEYAQSVGKSIGEVEQKFSDLQTAQENILRDAGRAYETAGLSANQYLETVTSFSASLIQSLDGDTLAASEYANRAIIDMSDNANKMGSDMASIQTAYNGFAKQNYTMLDNLKLGYGGTKEEMARLIADASKMTDVQKELGVTVDSSSMSFGNIVNAISVMQKSLGIAGTTAKEAATTISGSLGMLKAAWANVLEGIADEEQDFGALLDNLVSSVSTFAGNIRPRIEIALQGVGKLITGLAPVIVGALPPLINEVIPPLLSAAVELVKTFSSALFDALPMLLSMGGDMLMSLVDGILQGLPSVLSKIGEVVGGILDMFTNSDAISKLLSAGANIIMRLAEGIGRGLPKLLRTGATLLVQFVNSWYENLPVLYGAGLTILEGLVEGIMDALPILIDALPQIVQNMVDAFVTVLPMLIDAGIQLISMIVENLPTIINGLINALPQVIQSVVNGLIALAPQLIDAWIQLFTVLSTAWPQISETLINAIPAILDGIVEGFRPLIDLLVTFFSNLWEEVKATFADVVDAIGEVINGIVEWWNTLPERIAFALGAALGAIRTWISNMAAAAPEVKANVVEAVVSFFQELPSKLLSAFNAAKNRFTEFLSNLKNAVVTKVPSMISQFISFWTNLPSQMAEVGRNVIQGLWNGINDKFNSLLNDLKQKIQSIKNAFQEGFDTHSPSRWFDWLGRMNTEGFRNGMSDLLNPAGIVSEINSALRQVEALDMVSAVDMNANAGMGGTVYNQTINVNDRISTPDELARAVRLESRYGLMRGVSLG